MSRCEIVGGQWDGAQFDIPGQGDPPRQVSVLIDANGQVKLWHPAIRGIAEYRRAPLCLCRRLDDQAREGDQVWTYDLRVHHPGDGDG